MVRTPAAPAVSAEASQGRILEDMIAGRLPVAWDQFCKPFPAATRWNSGGAKGKRNDEEMRWAEKASPVLSVGQLEKLRRLGFVSFRACWTSSRRDWRDVDDGVGVLFLRGTQTVRDTHPLKRSEKYVICCLKANMCTHVFHQH